MAGPHGRERVLNHESGDLVLCPSFAIVDRVTHASHLTFLQLIPPFSKTSLITLALPISI